jgi:hypothetical protein
LLDQERIHGANESRVSQPLNFIIGFTDLLAYQGEGRLGEVYAESLAEAKYIEIRTECRSHSLRVAIGLAISRFSIIC